MFLENFDYTSPNLTFYYNSKRSQVSIFGGIITIISYTLCVLISCYFFSDVIFRKNPGIFFYNRVVTDAGIFPLNSKSMFHYVFIKNVDIDELGKYIQIISFRNLYVTNYNKDGDRENYEHYIYDRCKIDLDDLSYNNIKDDLNYTEYNLSFCLTSFYNKTTKKIISVKDNNFPIPSVAHGMSSSKGTYYGVFIQKCHNSSIINNNSCPSQIEIDNYTNNNNMSVGFSIINYEVIVENYKKPFRLSMNKITNGILNDAFTVNHLNFQPLGVITHDGFFIDKKKEGNYYLYEQNEKNTLETETGILASFYIWMQNKKQIYERSYKKVQNVMGDIGGSIKIIITLASWINYLSYKHTVFLDINKVINLYCYFNDQNLSNNKNHFISLNIKNSAIYKNNNIMNIMENSNRSSDKSNKININKNYNKININNINNNNNNNINNNNSNNSKNKKKIINNNNSFNFSNLFFNSNENIKSRNNKYNIKNYLKDVKLNNNLIKKIQKENIKKKTNNKNINNNNNNKNNININNKINNEQLKEIKNNLDENLKKIFNFSYEYFLNKESETESKKSLEENNQKSNKYYLK